jgi:hypothetical protein
MNKITEIYSKIEMWHKKTFLIIGIITATQFLTPYVISIYNFFTNSYKVQRDYNGISSRLTNLEDYTEVLNGIVDGVGDTRYHRGIRYLITKGVKDRTDNYKILSEEERLRWDLAHCDWYYKNTDTDGIVKWFNAQYNTQKDIFGYIDHDGNYHVIKTRLKSKLLKTY